MNNIQKAFKQKAKFGLRMAAGGVVPFGTLTNSDGSVSADSMEHPLNKLSMVDKNALGLDISAAGQSDMAARLDAQQNLFAASNNGRTSNVFAGIDMQPTQGLQATPAQPTIEQDVAARGKRIAGLKDRLRALGSPGYKEGGMVQDFTGKGRPDKDTVPAMLAHGEAVLPAKTVTALGGPEAIEELIESTNGKPSATAQQKKGLRGGVLHAFTGFPGDTIDPRELRPEFRSQAQTPVIEPAASNAAEVNRNSRAAINMNRAANAPGVSEAQAARAAASGEAATAASQASSQAAKQGFLRSALGTVGRMIVNPATVAAGTAYAGFKAPQWLDSIPDLRGKATAASTDMTLAGTPQHDEEVQKELIAKDDEWEREHNQSLGEQHARGSSNFDVKPAATATEAELARNEDLRNASLRAYDPAPGLVGMPTPKTLNDGTKVFTGMSKQDATQMQAPVGGGYITGQPDANGLRKAIFMPGEQTPYTGADGKPTTDWTKTQAYSEGVARANKDKALLAEMQRDRVTRDAFDPTIRDPKVHALAQQQLAQMNQRDAVMGEQGLRKQFYDQQGKYQNDQLQLMRDDMNQRIAMQNNALAKADSNDKLNHMNETLRTFAAGALPEQHVNDFITKVQAGHVGGVQMPDGTWKSTVGDLDKLPKAAQQKAMNDLLGAYLMNKQAYKYRTTRGTVAPLDVKDGKTTNWSDVSLAPGSTWRPMLTSDDDTDMTVGKYLRSKLPNIIGIDDKMLDSHGMRVRQSDIIKEYTDKNGNPVWGKADAQAYLDKQLERNKGKN